MLQHSSRQPQTRNRLRIWTVFCAAALFITAGTSPAANFQLNPAGVFTYSASTASGTHGLITNVGERTVDDALLSRVHSAMLIGANGFTSNLIPISAPLNMDITLDELFVRGDDPPDYPGAGWQHAVRYAGANLDGWRMIWMIGRGYSPDSGFGAQAYEQIEPDAYSDPFLAANFPFRRETEYRNDSTSYGAFSIAESLSTTWYTIHGSYLEMENTYLLARVNGDNLEIGGAWGFHERVDAVPGPTVLGAMGLGLVILGRRGRS